MKGKYFKTSPLFCKGFAITIQIEDYLYSLMKSTDVFLDIYFEFPFPDKEDFNADKYDTNSYDKYVTLYFVLYKVLERTIDPNLKLLFKITQEALLGAMNSYAIYGNNLFLKLENNNLQNQINDILSKKNEKVVELANATGQLNITKSFKLASVFNNYILIYGLPQYGVGFDPVKIAFLADLLRNKGIDPYK